MEDTCFFLIPLPSILRKTEVFGCCYDICILEYRGWDSVCLDDVWDFDEECGANLGSEEAGCSFCGTPNSFSDFPTTLFKNNFIYFEPCWVFIAVRTFI